MLLYFVHCEKSIEWKRKHEIAFRQQFFTQVTTHNGDKLSAFTKVGSVEYVCNFINTIFSFHLHFIPFQLPVKHFFLFFLISLLIHTVSYSFAPFSFIVFFSLVSFKFYIYFICSQSICHHWDAYCAMNIPLAGMATILLKWKFSRHFKFIGHLRNSDFNT